MCVVALQDKAVSGFEQCPPHVGEDTLDWTWRVLTSFLSRVS